MAFGFPPKGWALCNGQVLPINQNAALFSLLGTTYGGDGVTTFALPNLQGQVPIHVGPGYALGQKGGEQYHTLLITETPAHTHQAVGSTSSGSSAIPSSTELLGAVPGMYGAATSLTSLGAGTVGFAGSSQPHPNMQPFLTVSFCIALQGLFPTRS